MTFPLRLAAVASVLMALRLGAQIPPGHFLAVAAGPAGALFTYEPLAAHLAPLSDPLALVPPVRRAVIGTNPDTLLAAVDTGTITGSALIAELQLTGRQITGFRALTRDLTESVVGLDRMPDGTLVFATETRLYGLPTGSTNQSLLANAPVGVSWTALTTFANRVMAIGVTNGRATTLCVVDRTTGAVAFHQLGILGARSIEFDSLRGGLLVGDDGGSLWLVDLLRFIASPLGVTVQGSIDAMSYDADRAVYLLATQVGLFEFDGASVSGPTPASAMADLDHLPYDSNFAPYGQGCASPTLTPALSAAGRPYPGSIDFTVRLSGATPSAVAFLALGLLPSLIPLDPIGMPNCTLLLQPLDLLPAPTSAVGTTAIRLAIPPDASLAGAMAFAQWIAVAPGANAAGFLTTSAGRIRF